MAESGILVEPKANLTVCKILETIMDKPNGSPGSWSTTRAIKLVAADVLSVTLGVPDSNGRGGEETLLIRTKHESIPGLTHKELVDHAKVLLLESSS
jgi:hypothetical protein